MPSRMVTQANPHTATGGSAVRAGKQFTLYLDTETVEANRLIAKLRYKRSLSKHINELLRKELRRDLDRRRKEESKCAAHPQRAAS